MNKKNILITCKLDDNALYRHLNPLLKSSFIKKIVIIREKPGVSNKKIEYIVSTYRNKILKNTQKIRLILKNSKHADIIWGFYLVPHGINALIAAKIKGKKVGISLIGTDINIHLKSKYKKILIYALNKFNYITVTGRKSRRYLIKEGVDKNKIFILPNAVDTKRFKIKKRKKVYDFLFVGRLVQIKNVDKIILLLSKLNENNDYKLAIIGDGPEKNNLIKLTKKLNMEKNIKFLGYKDDVENYMNMSKFFIMASESEGLPLSMLEAMSCGIVPIVPDVGDITDVANKNNAIIYKSINTGLYEKIRKYSTDKKAYHQLSKNASKKSSIYSDDNVIKFWEKIIIK